MSSHAQHNTACGMDDSRDANDVAAVTSVVTAFELLNGNAAKVNALRTMLRQASRSVRRGAVPSRYDLEVTMCDECLDVLLSEDASSCEFCGKVWCPSCRDDGAWWAEYCCGKWACFDCLPMDKVSQCTKCDCGSFCVTCAESWRSSTHGTIVCSECAGG